MSIFVTTLSSHHISVWMEEYIYECAWSVKTCPHCKVNMTKCSLSLFYLTFCFPCVKHALMHACHYLAKYQTTEVPNCIYKQFICTFQLAIFRLKSHWVCDMNGAATENRSTGFNKWMCPNAMPKCELNSVQIVYQMSVANSSELFDCSTVFICVLFV